MEVIWKRADWPNFTYNTDGIQDASYRYAAEAKKTEVLIDLMVTEVIRTSQIEGEQYDRDDIRYSISNQL